jgi:hypothetical protein
MNAHKSIGTRASLDRITNAIVTRAGLFMASVLAAMSVCLAGSASYASAAACSNETFRIGPSSALPDCRAYEMVSPPNKNGGEIDGGVHKAAIVPPQQAASNGESVTYASTSAFVDANPESAVVSSQYLSRRTPAGWQTRGIVPVQQFPEGRTRLSGEGNPEFSMFQGFNEDLSDGFLLAWNPQPNPSAPSRYFNPYLRDDVSGGYQLLSSVTPPVQPAGVADLSYEGFGVTYAGMSTDGKHVIFEANDALTAEAIPGRVNLYEWSAGRPLELINVLPEGAVVTGGTYVVFNDDLTFGASNAGYTMPSFAGALSSDGARAFWNGGPSTGSQLYMHETTGSGSRTVEVSASQNPAVLSGSAPAHFWGANKDGSLVYFTSSAKLTEDSTATTESADLYRYDVDTGVLSDLSIDVNPGESAGVQGVMGTGESEGVPYVYFAAHGALAGAAVSGANNVYVSSGAGSTPVFVATLGEYEAETSDFNPNVTIRTSRVSPDGKFVAFQTVRPLTGYDNIPANGQACPEPSHELVGLELEYRGALEGRCTEVYEYDTQAGKLTCVSCNPNGLPPVANSTVPEMPHLYGNIEGWESPTVQQRYLLDDGRLFFQSEDGLLAQATNGRKNVYEYEPEGVGQCATSGLGGCLYLISTGQSNRDSYFVDASTDGRDVFVVTNEQLVSQDGDGAGDLYDAREGGGFSSVTPPPCAGEACKPAVTPAPAIYGAPSSATFQGAGNTAALTVTTTAKNMVKTKPAIKRKSKKRKRKARARSGGRGRAQHGRSGRFGGRSERGRR